jgi:hypothetical protein
VNREFQTVESLWREFWRSQDNNNGDECEEEKYLSKYVYIYQFCADVEINIHQSPDMHIYLMKTVRLKFVSQE